MGRPTLLTSLCFVSLPHHGLSCPSPAARGQSMTSAALQFDMPTLAICRGAASLCCALSHLYPFPLASAAHLAAPPPTLCPPFPLLPYRSSALAPPRPSAQPPAVAARRFVGTASRFGPRLAPLSLYPIILCITSHAPAPAPYCAVAAVHRCAAPCNCISSTQLVAGHLTTGR